MLIRTTIKPGDIGYIIYLHGTLYSREYDLDYTFEAYVAETMGVFARRYDPTQDYFAVAEQEGRILGTISIVGQPDQTAQLRWFLVHPGSRGQGLGRKLVEGALAFCRERKFKSVFLWTVSELTTAAHLYAQAGFRLTEEKTHEIWGKVRTEQRYDLELQT